MSSETRRFQPDRRFLVSENLEKKIILFQQNGALPEKSVNVDAYLNHELPEIYTARGRLISRSPRSFKFFALLCILLGI